MCEFDINNYLLDVDLKKYIEWYKEQSEKAYKGYWLGVNLWNTQKVLQHSNYKTGTYISKKKAKQVEEQAKKKQYQLQTEIHKLGGFYQYDEYYLPTAEEWQTFDKIITQNEYLEELNRLLRLCKDTKEARINTIQNYVMRTAEEYGVQNATAYKSFEPIYLYLLGKRMEFTPTEIQEKKDYLRECAFFSLVCDYYYIELIDYVNNLIQIIEKNDTLKMSVSELVENAIKKPLRWNAQKNIIGTMFGVLLKEGVISGNATDIAKGLSAMFSNLSYSTLYDNIKLNEHIDDTGKVTIKHNAEITERMREIVEFCQSDTPTQKK